MFETTIPRWSPGEEHEFDCPRIDKNEKEYLITINDLHGKIMSKIIVAEEVKR